MQDIEYNKMVLRLDCGVGMNTAEFYLVPVTMTEQELEALAWEEAVQFAQGYGIENEADRPNYESEEEEEDDRTEYSSDIAGWFEPYNAKKHDGLRMGNGDDNYWPELK